jgi:hypothetical protein
MHKNNHSLQINMILCFEICPHVIVKMNLLLRVIKGVKHWVESLQAYVYRNSNWKYEILDRQSDIKTPAYEHISRA